MMYKKGKSKMGERERVSWIYVHNKLWYINNRIGIDEWCRRLRKLDAMFNKDSKYYKIYHPK